MLSTVRRSAYVSTTTILFGYMGNKAGESVDGVCKVNEYFCGEDEFKNTGEIIGTLGGAYVGLLVGIGFLAIDIYRESTRVE